MPGNDLTALRDIIPASSTQQATARANITTILTGILNDIEPKVTPAGLDMTSALSFLSGGVYSPVTNVGYLNLQDRAATPAVNESLYVKDDELYYRDGGGNDIAITSSGSVNAAAGNITGSGYGSSNIELRWDNTPQEYLLKHGSGTHDLADVVVDRVRMSDGSSYFATLGAAASMAATLAFTLPQAFPGATEIMTMDSSGNMDHTATPSITSLTASSTVTGSDLKHTGDRYLDVSVASSVSPSGLGTYIVSGGKLYWSSSAGSDQLYIPIQIPEGSRIIDITVSQRPSATTPGQIQAYVTDSAGTLTSKGTSSFATGTATAWRSDTYTPTAFTMGADEGLILYFNPNAANDFISHVRVRYTRP